MKIYKLLIPILCGLFISTAAGDLRAQDSCLKIWNSPYDSGFYWTNPDSVKIDSCETSPTFGEKFARNWYLVEFTYYVLPAPPYTYDAIIDRSSALYIMRHFYTL